MSAGSRGTNGWIAVVCAVAIGACGDGGASPDAGSGSDDGGVRGDAMIPPDAQTGLSWVDFATSGCDGQSSTETGDAGPVTTCSGAAPLTLRFSAIAPATIDSHLWRFGDGSEPNLSATPLHTYRGPGDFAVSLDVEGPGGTASIYREHAILVSPAPLGAACGAGEHCATGQCVCDDETLCPAGLATGMCTASCAQLPCDSGVCVDLDRSQSAPDAVWRDQLCLVDCSDGSPCPPGLVCRDLIAADDSGWVRACLAPGLLGDIGDSCADSQGALQSYLCAAGECLDAGNHGLCAPDCTLQDCPDGSACATFVGDGPTVCLASCDTASCDSDPGLACADPGTTFTVDADPPAAAGYCAPLQ